MNALRFPSPCKHSRHADRLYTCGFARVKQQLVLWGVSSLYWLQCLSASGARHKPFLLLTSAQSGQPLQSINSPAKNSCEGHGHFHSLVARFTTINKHFIHWGIGIYWTLSFIWNTLQVLRWNLLTLWYNRLFSHSNNFWMDLRVCYTEKHTAVKCDSNHPLKTFK